MTEPDVALTDYALAVECGVFAYLLSRQASRNRSLSAWFVLFFGATTGAALAGGTVHGFFLDERTLGARVLWPAALLALGLVALAAWEIGATLRFAPPLVRKISLVARAEFVVYAGVVFFVSQAFAVAVLNYLPAMLFLVVVFGLEYRRTRARAVRLGFVGLVLSLVASAIQQSGIALHPVYFNHNALYHVIQVVALFMIFLAARWLVDATDV
jgi:hypothetical protein